ncbi:MAG TPA: asparagine synthase (glutamine-hydrolyzing) [Thermoanaerobaculia bacterium]|nr:asparagine synthase (glutamine-hydrolyzing) [Thermoanaerobaculia bacterium]
MCGIAGVLDLCRSRPADPEVLRAMTASLEHRGPDSAGFFREAGLGLGFRRLRIIDLEGGEQPMTNEDGSLVLACNGEVFNHRELRRELEQRGHQFRSRCDVEVLLHLYEEHGVDLLRRINGQFAFALYDRREGTLLLARDPFGVNPLHYTVCDGTLIFASEIKSILTHPLVRREVDLTGLDQVLSLPGLVSPRTIFKGISSLKSGHYLRVRGSEMQLAEYWDLDYPEAGEAMDEQPEAFYVERLAEAFARSVELRLCSDVEVGFYLSGGLDSSLIATMIHRLSPERVRHSFSISFPEREMSEEPYQRIVAASVGSIHHDIPFDWDEISSRFRNMVYHCECPVKETYNTCSMALSEAARRAGVTVVLTGEGADELFAGYVGYRFDGAGLRGHRLDDLEAALEAEARERLWGDADLFYETDHAGWRDVKRALYSDLVNERFGDFEFLNFELVNRERIRGRHPIHQRSYLDFKLRLADHLISDHGDRMAMANSIEARYPFLDPELVQVAIRIPPHLKLNGLQEKYILKKMAEPLLPAGIVRRDKFGFHAPGTPYLLQQGVNWVQDMLSTERIRRGGYFNPAVVDRLKAEYSQPGFKLNLPFETDLLAIVLSFEVLREVFGLPAIS